MKIAIIGLGASSIGFLHQLRQFDDIKDKLQIDIFEKSKNIKSTSLSGIRSDGKLIVSSHIGGDIEISLEMQREIVKLYYLKEDIKPSHHTNIKSAKSTINICDRLLKADAEILYGEYYHLGSDQISNNIQILLNQFQDEFKNINIYFGHNVHNVTNNHFWYYDSDNNNHITDEYDYIIISVGRSGYKLLQNIKYDNNIQTTNNKKIDIGVRLEMKTTKNLKYLNAHFYECKIFRRSKFSNYNVRTFCNNPNGFVVKEKYDDGLIGVNGHSMNNKQSDNTNVAILVTAEFTYPFNHPIDYGQHISRLANLLTNNKVMLQRLDDFRNGKRTKTLLGNSVYPTLPEEEYVLGDLNLVFPTKIQKDLVDFLDNISTVIHEYGKGDNLLYGVENKFYTEKFLHNKTRNLYIIGDCSGWTRSIVKATGHGMLLAQELKKEF